MKAFRDWSIRHKLTGLFMAMACITTVAISLPLGIFDFWGTRKTHGPGPGDPDRCPGQEQHRGDYLP